MWKRLSVDASYYVGVDNIPNHVAPAKRGRNQYEMPNMVAMVVLLQMWGAQWVSALVPSMLDVTVLDPGRGATVYKSKP